jgi:ABC-type Fe3+/spermidine/putrescine transport system ATPase subunit
MYGVELRSVTKRYGETAAVDEVSIAIKAAEFLTLLGPSGCGKTTTLRIVAGLQSPDAGLVRILDQDVTALSPAERNIGMVFQSLALFPHMTAAENVAFGLRMRHVPKAQIAERVARTLTTVRLERFADRYPHQLSGGQQQRVALARALVIEPSILVLDEPFASLDRKLREAMQQELRAITRELRITSLFVTHDQEEALMLSDWVAVMNKGRIEQFGTPWDVFWRPVTRFVADFMGATNFVRATVASANGNAGHLSFAGQTFVLSSNKKLGAGDEIEVVIRPEWIEITSTPPVGNSGIAAKVVDATFHGHLSTYIVRLGDQLDLTVRKNNRRTGTPDAVDFSIGENVWLSWPSDAMQIVSR